MQPCCWDTRLSRSDYIDEPCSPTLYYQPRASQEADLKRLHEGAIKNDPFVSRALGPKAKLERMKAAALRLGSQARCSLGIRHCISLVEIQSQAGAHEGGCAAPGLAGALLIQF